MTLNEAQTRTLQIDPQLQAADWKLKDRTQVRLEVPVDGYDATLANPAHIRNVPGRKSVAPSPSTPNISAGGDLTVRLGFGAMRVTGGSKAAATASGAAT